MYSNFIRLVGEHEEYNQQGQNGKKYTASLKEMQDIN